MSIMESVDDFALLVLCRLDLNLNLNLPKLKFIPASVSMFGRLISGALDQLIILIIIKAYHYISLSFGKDSAKCYQFELNISVYFCSSRFTVIS